MTGATPSAPPWGAACRHLWSLEPGTRHLNHGAFGATPLAIAAEQTRWRDLVERNPARFFMNEMPQFLREARAALAAFVGTDRDRLAFVENATSGTATVLRSLRLRPGDEIVTTDHVYNALRNLLRHLAGPAGARVIEAPLGMPVADAPQILAAVEASLSPATRLVVIDHVASASAVTFPVAALVALCRGRGIPVLVDGAHAPGLLDLDVDALDADWYVGNCHKWLCAPKGSAFLAVAPRAAEALHPLAISHAYGQGFGAEFDKTGTRDASSWLSVPAAIRFHEELGGKALRARNRALALAVAEQLAAAIPSQLGAAPDLFQAMVTIELPSAGEPSRVEAARLHDALWAEGRLETEIMLVAGGLYLRISVQAYNEVSDFEDLPELLRRVVPISATAASSKRSAAR